MWPEIVSPSCLLDSLSHMTWPLDLTVVDQRKAVTGPVAYCMVVSLSCSRGDICSRGSCPIVRGLHDATNLPAATIWYDSDDAYTETEPQRSEEEDSRGTSWRNIS